MKFFKKKIDTVDYWKHKVDYLFSQKFEKAFQLLLITKAELFDNVSESKLKEHIIASYIGLINITIAKNNGKRVKRYEIAQISDNYIQSKCESSISELASEYNSEFGSSMIDGIRPMAKHFSQAFHTNKDQELEDFIYDLLYVVLRDSFDEIKKIKLT